MPREDVHQRLEHLMLDHGERDEPIAFAGREEIIQAICLVAERLSDRRLRGQTFVIGGSPGAGKTSLVFEAAKRLGQIKCRSVVCPDPTNDHSIDSFLWDLASKLTGEDKSKLQKAYKTHLGITVGVEGVGHVRGEYGQQTTPLALGTIYDMPSLTRKRLQTPVVVFIDEAQNVKEGSKAAGLITSLHTQNEFPVLLVCAGLANTYDQLCDIGLTRPEDRHVIALGALESEETLSAATKALRVVAEAGVNWREVTLDALAMRIAVASDNWPRHLTCYLQSVCESLIEHDRPDFEQLDQDLVIERGDDLRERYYKRRLTSSNLPVGILASVYEQIQSSRLTRDECAGLLELSIQQHHQVGAVTLRRRFATGEDAFRQALRSGVITINEDGMCEIPIPSMRTFVIAKNREAQARHLKRERMGSLGRK